MATATTPLTGSFLILLITSNLNLCSSFRSYSLHGQCKPSGFLRGKSGHCNRAHDSDCCKTGKKYPQFRCSPPLNGDTRATMTINSFAEGGDGGGRSECDNQWHKDSELVVALSTGWYDSGSRCLKNVRINANGNSVLAKVVDECDSVHGCDKEHDFQPPCPNNIVDASPAVWKALGIHGSEVGDYQITWSDE
ncbi:putative ripening-related protein 1 [Typha angustifolia]|uniref:putative ripening-related protein 1 n=1 Tax=Typha angustifolia TaxID=59011 RepID=UPI003C2B959A